MSYITMDGFDCRHRWEALTWVTDPTGLDRPETWLCRECWATRQSRDASEQIEIEFEEGPVDGESQKE